jgi:tripartite-type tricarboxylate transporter receptor subunit TctC
MSIAPSARRVGAKMARAFLVLACAVLATMGVARAQTYPSRTIIMVVPFGAGGPLDTVARTLADRMRVSLGQQVVIENVTGASGTIGVGRVARATPDGYTVSIGNWPTHVVNGAVFQLQYDLLKDFEPVARLSSNPYVLVGKKGLPAADLKELIAWLKANPDKASVATVGAGSPSHVSAVYFANATGAPLNLVPYRGGGPALQDVVGGHVDLFIATPQAVIELIRSDQVKAFGVTAKEPLPQLPQVKSMAAEISPDLEVLFWTALFAPASTPERVLAKIAAVIDQAISSEAMVKAWATSGMQAYPKESRTPEAGDTIFRAEVMRWSALVRENNIKAD